MYCRSNSNIARSICSPATSICTKENIIFTTSKVTSTGWSHKDISTCTTSGTACIITGLTSYKDVFSYSRSTISCTISNGNIVSSLTSLTISSFSTYAYVVIRSTESLSSCFISNSNIITSINTLTICRTLSNSNVKGTIHRSTITCLRSNKDR